MTTQSALRRRTLLAAAAGVAISPFAAGTAFAATPKVYLDPGHGGTDSGATGNGLVEKNLTLTIALQTRDILLANWPVAVRMSRTTDVTRSLQFRTDDA
jgi:N-acetylmuramoyl-L-alanine amidase